MIRLNNSKITDPSGYIANAVHSGLKTKKRDLMILVSEEPCLCSAVFTKNTVKAAPVLAAMQNLVENNGQVKALIVNSGNANCVTGKQGIDDVNNILDYLGNKIDVSKNKILMCSTGIIGKRLDVEKVKNGIDKILPDLNKENGSLCAESILTTDTCEKTSGYEIDINGKSVAVCGIAKGSGMINPSLATMLAFVTTDANIEKELLDELTKNCVESTFNNITVDGDMSTNDTVIVFANGASESLLIAKGTEEEKIFKQALYSIVLDLAKDIVLDGEGATKFIEILVNNAGTKKEANVIAKAIANSNLVKTACFGEDPNWGRILAAAGSTGIDFDSGIVELSINDEILLANGTPVECNRTDLLKDRHIKIVLDLNAGKEQTVVFTSDLSYDYVKINAEYST